MTEATPAREAEARELLAKSWDDAGCPMAANGVRSGADALPIRVALAAIRAALSIDIVEAVEAEREGPLPFNINDYVRVKLTEQGRKILAGRQAEYAKRFPGAGALTFPADDADGWSLWQLWDLMHEFGASMYNGCRVPFETSIIIEATAIRARPSISKVAL